MGGVKAEAISNVAGTKTTDTGDLVDGACRAWINFKATATAEIIDDFNCSSLIDNATGSFSFSFDTDMTDAEYLIAGGGVYDLATDAANSDININPYRNAAYKTTSSFRTSVTSNGGAYDAARVYILFFGN